LHVAIEKPRALGPRSNGIELPNYPEPEVCALTHIVLVRSWF